MDDKTLDMYNIGKTPEELQSALKNKEHKRPLSPNISLQVPLSLTINLSKIWPASAEAETNPIFKCPSRANVPL